MNMTFGAHPPRHGSMTSRILAWLCEPNASSTPLARRLVFTSFMIANFLVFITIAYGYGPSMTPDGHRDHALGVVLAETGFNLQLDSERVATLRRQHDMVQTPLPYFLYHSLLGIAHLIAGENWLNLWVLINAVGQTVVSGILLLLASRLFHSRAAFLGMGALTIGCWEHLQWISLSQSDTLFGLPVLGALLLVYRQWTSRTFGTSAAWALAATLVTLAAAFFRPTAVALVAFMLIAIVWGLFVFGKRVEYKARLLRRWLPILIAALLATLPVLILPMFDPSLLPEGSIRDSFSTYHERAALGMIVWDRPEYTISAPQGYGGYFFIALYRLFYFFLFVADGFSPAHNIINVLFFIPFYAFSAIGVWSVMRESTAILPQIRLIGLFAIGLILLFDMQHAATHVDFDWRYRSPTYPAMFLLATIGLEFVLMAYRDRLRNASSGSN